MSIPRGYPITCNNCVNQQNFTIWHSINVDSNPELREMVKNRTLFNFKCKKCGVDFNIEYKTLYHDSSNGFMIQYFPDNTTEEELKEFDNTIQETSMRYFEHKNYTFRKALDKNSLIETIYILEHHLNDILINVMKTIIYTSCTSELKDSIKNIYFYHADDEWLEFTILKNDNTTVGCKLPFEEYEVLKNDLILKEVEKWGCVNIDNVFDYVMNEDE